MGQNEMKYTLLINAFTSFCVLSNIHLQSKPWSLENILKNNCWIYGSEERFAHFVTVTMQLYLSCLKSCKYYFYCFLDLKNQIPFCIWRRHKELPKTTVKYMTSCKLISKFNERTLHDRKLNIFKPSPNKKILQPLQITW